MKNLINPTKSLLVLALILLCTSQKGLSQDSEKEKRIQILFYKNMVVGLKLAADYQATHNVHTLQLAAKFTKKAYERLDRYEIDKEKYRNMYEEGYDIWKNLMESIIALGKGRNAMAIATNFTIIRKKLDNYNEKIYQIDE